MAMFSLGVEEEIFICDAESGAPLRYPKPALMSEIDATLRGRVTPESMQCQFELKTGICFDMRELEKDIRSFRAEMLGIARKHGVRVLSSGLHPFAKWDRVPRHDNQMVAERANDYGIHFFRGITGAFHLHVGLDNDDLRTELAYLWAPFVSLLMALSANSPIFEGVETGLKSYRLAMLNSRPRSGYFPLTENYARYAQFRDTFTSIIRELSPFENSTANYRFLGYVRPNHRHATLEFRLFDGGPNLDALIPIFALVVALTKAMTEDLEGYRRFRCLFSEELLDYNAFEAVRCGVDARFILPSAFGARELETEVWAAELIDELRNAAAELRCGDLLSDCSKVARENSASNLQLETFRRELAFGRSSSEAAIEATKGLMDAFDDSVGG